MRLEGDLSKILGLTEHLYAAMYDPLSPTGRGLRVDQYWCSLLKAVHEAAYVAFPDLTPRHLELAFPMYAKRASPLHWFSLAELRTSGKETR